MPDPIIYPTPYGARLEFMLPNNNLMYVHLKNKDKIRLVYNNIYYNVTFDEFFNCFLIIFFWFIGTVSDGLSVCTCTTF